MESLVRQHCSTEATRPETEAVNLYTNRLEREIAHSVYTPFCLPYIAEGRKNEWEWVDTNKVALKQGFSFYHHSRDQVLEYSVAHRGDADLHLRDMDGLYLDEFPNPLNSESVYMVSSNGEHRRLVFSCIGIPRIRACVQKAPTTIWRYYWKSQNRTATKIFLWFKQLGLITFIKKIEQETLIFEGPNNLAGWLLPDSQLGSISNMLDEIQARAEALDERFSLDADLMKLLRSKIRRRFSLELACIGNHSGERSLYE